MVSTDVNKIQYTLSGTFPSTYSVPFKYWDKEEIVAILSFDDGTADQDLVLDTDYSLTDPDDTGTLTRLTTWDADAVRLTVYRSLDILQQTDYRDGEAVPMEQLEQDFDRAVAMIQQVKEITDRQSTIPITDVGAAIELPSRSSRADKVLGFDSDGDAIAVDIVAVPVSDYMKTVLDDADAATARSTLAAASALDLVTHAALTGSSAHGAVSAATANQIIVRDASGRASVAAPSAAGDIAILSTVTTHAGLTGSSAHGATSANTASQIVTRGASGEIAVGIATLTGCTINNGYGYVYSNSDSTGYNFGIELRRSRGTYASPTAVVSGNSVGYLAFNPYNGTSYVSGASISGIVSGAPGTYVPTDVVIYTSTSSLVSVERLRITSGGQVLLPNTSVAHGITDLAPTNTYAQFAVATAGNGGCIIRGFTHTTATDSPLILGGIFGDTDPADTIPAFCLYAGKKSGTALAALAAAEIVFQLRNYTTNLITVLGNGNVGFGTVNPISKHFVYDPTPNRAASLSFNSVATAIFNNATVELAMGTHDASPYSFWLQARNSSSAAQSIALNPLGGNVGAGRFPTTYAFEVQGDIYATGALRGTTGVFAGAVSGITTLTASGVVTAGGGLNTGDATLLFKIVDIGDWNMDSTDTLNKAHGMSYTKIRFVQAYIRNDADTLSISIEYEGDVSIGSTYITLHRTVSGFFDGTNYDSTSYNRGYLIIWYIP